MERHDGSLASPTLEGGSPLAHRTPQRRLAGRLAGAVRSIAADLGDRGVHIALGLAACIAVLAILGGVDGIVTPIQPFDAMAEMDLDRPLSEAIAIPAIFSGVLLFTASGLAIVVAAHSERFPWVAIGAFFAFMGIDELAGIHERMGTLVGVAWEIAYMPVVLVGGVFWLWTLTRMWQINSERVLWLGGAAAWVLAEALEATVLSGDESWSLIGELSLVEETLELAGSSMFLLALYLVAQRLAAGQPRLGGHHAGAEHAVQLSPQGARVADLVVGAEAQRARLPPASASPAAPRCRPGSGRRPPSAPRAGSGRSRRR